MDVIYLHLRICVLFMTFWLIFVYFAYQNY